LIPILGGGDWSASSPSCFTHVERAPGTPFDRRHTLKSRTILDRWGHVARMGNMRNAYKTFVEKPEGKRQFNLRVDERIILEWILEK
jgi:hypothetical protein